MLPLALNKPANANDSVKPLKMPRLTISARQLNKSTEKNTNNFYTSFAQGLTTAISKKSIDSCGDWAKQFRIMGNPIPGKWTFKYHPWLEEMHNSKAMHNVGQKSAQMGYTETLINWTFYNIDILKQSCLYVLPTDDNANDFSASRFDPALDASEHLEHIFSDTKNKGHKRAGLASLYLRGSRAKNKLISIPVARIAIDELDQMVQEHIELVWERMSGQFDKQSWSISTPTVEGYGINKAYKHTTMEHLFFKCPHCSKLIDLDFPKNLEVCGEHQDDLDYKKSRIFCDLCGMTLEQGDKLRFLKDHQWVPTNQSADKDNRGFYVNQLYSSTISPAELAYSYLKGLDDEDAEREFFNSKLGKPHVPSSYQINDEDITACCKNYTMAEHGDKDKFITMGIDVGKKLHYVICEWDLDAYLEINDNINRIITCGSVDHFEELNDLISTYNVDYSVIDANPERRASTKFCLQNAGKARMCFYGIAKMDKNITPSDTEPIVSVNRASWIDLTIKKIKKQETLFPANITMEFKLHIKANVKIVKQDGHGNIVFIFDELGKPDHLHHALVYNEVALKCAFLSQGNKNITQTVT